jgi:hypothetical protein
MWPEIDPHRDYVLEMLKAGVTKATIWQRLRDEHGLCASLKRWITATLPEENLRERVTVLREDPPAGQEATDRLRLSRILARPDRRAPAPGVGVRDGPGSKPHMFVRPVLTMDQHAWTECHVAAFEFFGGAPARLVPDNLRTGVDRPDLYDPKINRSYAELAEHYGCLVDPARAGKPKDKPRVERPMPYVRDSFWRGRQSAACPRCRPRPFAGACRWPVGGSVAHWAGPPRPRCSTQWSGRHWRHCRAPRSCWPAGRLP